MSRVSDCATGLLHFELEAGKKLEHCGEDGPCGDGQEHPVNAVRYKGAEGGLNSGRPP